MTEKVVIEGKLVEGYVPPNTLIQTRTRRSNARMIYDFLLIAKSFDKYFRIMTLANLSYSKTKEILKKLKEKNLVTIEEAGSGKYSVRLTKEGLKTVKLGKKFLTLIGEL